MNKIHRTVWSEAHQGYVVTHEKSAARGKPSSLRNGTAQAVAAAVLSLAAGQAMAAPIGCGSSTPNSIITNSITGPCLVKNGVSVDVQANGTISGSWAGVAVYTSHVTAGGITNSGSISGASAGIVITDGNTVTGSVTNSGTIFGSSVGIQINRTSSVSGGITNSGTISSGNGAGIAINSGSSVTGGITNSGTIISGNSTGIHINSSTVSGGITNSGRISGNSSAGIGIYGGSTVTGGITNSGSISGASTGIHVINSTVSGGLTNSGTISGGSYAIYVDGSSSLNTITIAGANTAKFIGAVYAPNTSVTVASDATYTMDDGNLFTVQRFTNAGTLKVGAGSTGTVTGDFSNTNTGTFSPKIASMTSYGKLHVSGTATLSGALSPDATGATGLAAGTLSGIITAGAISGSFSSCTLSGSVLSCTALYTSTEVDLKLAATSTTAVSQAIATAGNTQASGAAAVLDRIFQDNTSPIFNLLSPVALRGGDDALSNAVTQILPAVGSSGAAATGSALSGINGAVQSRIEGQHGRSSGDIVYGDQRFWMKPFGSWSDQADRSGVAGYKGRVAGVVFGADATISDESRVGLALAYANANITGNSSVAPSGSKIDVYQLVGYGSYDFGDRMDLSYQLDVGSNKNRGHRDLLFAGTTASSNYSSFTAHAGLGLTRSYDLNSTTSLTPSLRIDYTTIRDKAHSETGAGALDLNVAGQTTDELIYAVDGKLAHKLDDGTTLSANLGLGYDAKAKAASITAAFAGAPGLSFVTQGAEPPRTMVRGGLGVTTTPKNGPEITARYDLEHRSGFNNQTLSAKLRWAF